MSTGTVIPWAKAAETTAAFIKLIQGVAPLRVCGSLRRRKPYVGDVEIVACLDNRAALLARLDKLVWDGLAEKAVYEEGKNRWGEKHAGLVFRDVRFEVFSAMPDNIGYITWLRTGPGDANTLTMTLLSAGWPIRFDDGQAWHVEYVAGLMRKLNRLRVPSEDVMFKLIGMEYVPPHLRTQALYRRFLKRTIPSADFIASLVVADQTPIQQSLL